jgi:hypothetical protein
MLVQLTLDDAKLLKTGDILYQTDETNRDGTPRRWKVNGAVVRWTKDPSRIRVPLKHGLRTYDYLDENSFAPNGTCMYPLAVEKAD